MKIFIAVLFFIALVACQSVPRSGKVIYGTDDRKDTYEVSSFLQNLGDSTVIILYGNNILTENNDGSFTATSTATAENFWGYCPEEPFSDQVILSNAFSFCSGFLLSTNPPWVGTAAHCTEGDIDDALIIFGFELTSASTTRLTFNANSVYEVDSVVVSGTPSGGAGDYGIFELDRTVTGYTPYTSFNPNMNVNDGLILIGHPNGLPKKTDDGGEVQYVDSSIIQGTVDAYGGNSGSPVFDSSGNLAGILVGGSQDFATYSPCQTSNVCPGGSGCFANGESIVPICDLVESNSQVRSVLGSCSSDDQSSFTSGVSSVSSNNDDDDDSSDASTLIFSLAALMIMVILI